MSGAAGRPAVLGVLLAGGRSTRYGSPKARAQVRGVALADRALAALEGAADRVAVVANDPRDAGTSRHPVRPDVLPGRGVLGGILTAVRWAREEGRDAALVLACDMPLVPAALLRRLAERAGPGRVVLPASDGPRGMEPLCAAYGAATGPAIEDALGRGERAVISFFADVEIDVLPIDEVRRFGPPERLFWNVNRPEDRARAERWLTADPGVGKEEGP
ncbi:MAG: molybdenum cofactor guanylyltransferase [Gemmatimonadota bacterium]|nr:molybdenum cofactor guanylyltransferase [Gemmatimonadota bacterium]